MNIGETNREFADRMDSRDDRHALMRRLGNREYIDEHTTAPDPRSTDEILDRKFKCCIGYTPPPDEPLKLKPATERDKSRDRQKHRSRE